MTLKDFVNDNGYKSKKFFLVLFGVSLIASFGVVWAVTLWPVPILNLIVDNMVVLILGYCGISATRAALPVASAAIAKTITERKQPLPQGKTTGINRENQI